MTLQGDDIDGDNEIIFEGKYVRSTIWLAKKIKDLEEDQVPVAFEFDNVMIGLQLWQFEELFNAVSKTKSAIEKRQMYE